MKISELNPVKLIKRFFEFYVGQTTLDQKIFWSIDPLIVVVGLASVFGTIAEGLGIWAVLTGVLCLVAAIGLGIACYRSGNDCRRYYIYLCLVLNCVLGPAIFLTNGGIDSGMPMYCFAFILLCAFCTTREGRHITASTSFLVYVLLLVLSSTMPEIVIPIKESFVHTDIILSFIVLVISMVIIISNAVVEVAHQRYDEVNAGLIASFSNILEFRSHETGSHIRNIRGFMTILLENANEVIPDVHFKKDEIRMISSAALLHDIGKVAVPDSILNKPGRLTKEEYEIVKLHTVDGCQMIETMKEFQDPKYYECCYQICRHHHEKYDGTGYPDGLRGEDIPLIAQLASVADVYEALTSKRVYKDSYSSEEAADIIINHSPGFYSDRVTECFIRSIPRFEEIINAREKEGK